MVNDGLEPAAMVEELWLAAYSRYPRQDEVERFTTHIASAEDKRAALEDVYWTVLNSKEFVFTH
jgi:hypothetical protein